MIKLIEDNNSIYAKIIRASNNYSNLEFFTNEDDELQFGIINREKDYKTGAHYHNHIKNKCQKIDEILIILKGSARIDFYNDKGAYIKSTIIKANDAVIIYKGGHNIAHIEDTKFYVIKPGVYDKTTNETRIIGANNLDLIIEED